MLGLIDFIGIFSKFEGFSFFSRSEWLDILSDMVIPTLIFFFSLYISKKQFKEQNEISENQLKEQNRIAAVQLKEQNRIAAVQLKEQNELALKKEKIMLATQIRIAKLEEISIDLNEYMKLADLAYNSIYQFNNKNIDYNEHADLIIDSRRRGKHLHNKTNDFCDFFPNLQEYFEYLHESYFSLLSTIPLKYSIINMPEQFADDILDNISIFKKQAANLTKQLSSIKISILTDLESDS